MVRQVQRRPQRRKAPSEYVATEIVPLREEKS